ncbi:DUF3134 domain-containing protein [Kamptonema cortianum]|nr:DUF3134 domain-containing protein [Oscillatoria laete-virens]MCD8485966.1 DUF3134 domain-containing protein [Desertifilum sp.]MDI9639126.1 DUF3134 domain-containing protein [Geitlerinema splendidum]MDK3157301.1 DUF3134 domain-containing protein [Kamptonema cortianum]NES95951.1 DUF3134 domain-containing protein [Desertifilum sp. SIO1I2]MDL5052948.1 DUF3134 domain-containing protein [Oscillatoria laete-virens NRMC-F 0139]
MYNPSLREEPRYKPAAVIPPNQGSSLIDWLEASGRLLARDNAEDVNYLDDEEEISELMGAGDNDYDDIDDDDDAIELED